MNYCESRRQRSFGSNAMCSSTVPNSIFGTAQKLNRAVLLSTTLRLILRAVEAIQIWLSQVIVCQLSDDGMAIAYMQARRGRAWQTY